jgi:predicted nucleic acid-binding protein
MLRIYIDADVLLAGLLSPSDHGAANVLLQLSEATILDAVASERVIDEAERNLEEYVGRPEARSLLDESIDAALDVVPNPSASAIDTFRSVADSKDVLHVACAVGRGCSHLVTYNLSDYPPQYGGGEVEELTVVTPGTLVRRIRTQMSGLS